jgi:hypothetical protein
VGEASNHLPTASVQDHSNNFSSITGDSEEFENDIVIGEMEREVDKIDLSVARAQSSHQFLEQGNCFSALALLDVDGDECDEDDSDRRRVVSVCSQFTRGQKISPLPCAESSRVFP